MKTKKSSKTTNWEYIVTNIQSNVLSNLGRFQFLTFSQMLKLNIGTKYYQYLWKQVASLRDRKRPLVKCHNFQVPQPRKGKVESLYYLSKRGKEFLINDLQFEEDKLKIPYGKSIAYRDYFHRKHTIDFQIELYKWADQKDITIPFFDTYFDKTGDNVIRKNLRAKTRIDFEGKKYFIPDGVFPTSFDKESKFFLFEMYQGKDSGRVLMQIHKHAQAMVSRFTHKRYKLPMEKSYNVVLLFENDSLKQAVIEKALKQKDTFNNIQSYFRLKSLENLYESEFENDWKTLLGEKENLI